MEITPTDAALESAMSEGYDEVIVVGINHDGGMGIHTTMDYTPDVFLALHIAAGKLMDSTGALND